MPENLIAEMLLETETELRSQINRLNEKSTGQFVEILTYHMGWTGEKANEISKGKRIRPLLLLLCSASGIRNYDWHNALPGAAAIELIHNFSLIHDDIEDGSDKRRNRPTVWKKWGVPQGINAGDALYSLSNLAATDLIQNNSAETVVNISRILHQTCLNLTRGQFLDMYFENIDTVTLDEYWHMIAYKTSALISASTEIGSILSGLDDNQQEIYRQFGHFLGLAFQIKDDILGIWGNEDKTGKSRANDLISHKKSLPVLFGLQKNGPFAKRWLQGNITHDEISEIAQQLTIEGSLLYTEGIADSMSDMANKFLALMSPPGKVGEALYSICEQLLKREA
jgi:geranylgeranyl diphosphate synthase type I